MPWIKIESEYDDLDKYQFDDGDIIYYKKDAFMYHNPYGAAYIGINGYKEYWLEGKLNRLDGPAIIWPTGEEFYYINHKELNKEEFKKHPDRLKYLGKEHLICLG